MSDWRRQSVLVTGCTGFLGSWLTRALVDRGAHVVGLERDRIPHGLFRHLGLADHVTLVRGSLEDLDLIERALNEYQVTAVFHLAAQTLVGTALRGPLPTLRTNVLGTAHVLEAARRLGTVERIVVASSDKAYGEHEQLPYTEEAPLRGEYPYDVSKSCADLIARSYARTYGLPVAITRCGNLYGGGDLNFSRIVPGTIRSILRGEPVIIRSDGTFVRDYFYVHDAVESYLTLAEAMDDSAIHGEAFNFGTEEPISVKDLVARLVALSGHRDVDIRIENQASHEIRAQYLSSRKAREHLGWRPAHDLDRGLKETLEWYVDYFQDIRPTEDRDLSSHAQ